MTIFSGFASFVRRLLCPRGFSACAYRGVACLHLHRTGDQQDSLLNREPSVVRLTSANVRLFLDLPNYALYLKPYRAMQDHSRELFVLLRRLILSSCTRFLEQESRRFLQQSEQFFRLDPAVVRYYERCSRPAHFLSLAGYRF